MKKKRKKTTGTPIYPLRQFADQVRVVTSLLRERCFGLVRRRTRGLCSFPKLCLFSAALPPGAKSVEDVAVAVVVD